MMNETKPWWQSKTVIAGMVAVIMAALQTLGVGGTEGQEETMTRLVIEIVTALAGILAIAGRFTASKKLTK